MGDDDFGSGILELIQGIESLLELLPSIHYTFFLQPNVVICYGNGLERIKQNEMKYIKCAWKLGGYFFLTVYLHKWLFWIQKYSWISFQPSFGPCLSQNWSIG